MNRVVGIKTIHPRAEPLVGTSGPATSGGRGNLFPEELSFRPVLKDWSGYLALSEDSLNIRRNTPATGMSLISMDRDPQALWMES